MLCETYKATIEYDHVVLVINDNLIFDPTDLLPNIYKEFYQIAAMRDLKPEKVVQNIIEEGYYIEIAIPKRIHIESYTGGTHNDK